MELKQSNWPEYILRIGVCGTFLGHGIFALQHKTAWLAFLTFWGISPENGLFLMTVIGIVDVIIALVTLFRPVKALLIYAAIWAFLTALMRPIAGGYLLDFVERFSNVAAPLALYLLLLQKNKK
ncbi:MAG: hypothetical protein HKN87_09605 [Saprospiraceae bacterium]|nr:hypothetical protein [Saprospiraceae bacterium]